MSQPHHTDPLLRNSRREAIIIGLTWLAATTYCCAYSYFFGYIREGQQLTKADLNMIFGVPSWVVWGYLVPWVVCAVFTFWFAGWYVVDDDLGYDHTAELESDIREGGVGG